MTIGERIKQRRIELGLSVDELADKLNKNKATIYRYENNDIENFPTTVLEPLAKVLETTPAKLMGWEDESFKKKWSEEIRPYFKKTDAFESQLKVLGWSCEFVGCSDWDLIDNGGMGYNDNGEMIEDGTGHPAGCRQEDGSLLKCEDCHKRNPHYVFTNGSISFKVTIEEYNSFMDDSQEFFKNRIQKLYSNISLFPQKSKDIILNAAHERTDIEVTDEMRKHDDDIMNNPDEWK